MQDSKQLGMLPLNNMLGTLLSRECSSLWVFSSPFVFPFLQEDMALPMFHILMHLFATKCCLRK